MTALFCAPISFTASTSGSFPQSNASNDQPGLVARGTSITAYFDSQSIDTIAIIGNQTGNVTISIGGGADVTVPSFTGTKAAGISTKTIYTFAPQTASTVTVTFASEADVKRLIIGKAIKTDGLDGNAEQGFSTQSVANRGNGYASFVKYQTLPTWKFRCSLITNAQWSAEFYPFFLHIGDSEGFLLVPRLDEPDTWQHEACFGRLTSMSKGQYSGYNNWIIDGVMTAVTP